MKKNISAVIIAALFATSAFAGNDNGPTTNNYDQRNYGGNTTNAGGLGGAGGNASATGGTSNATGGAVVGSGNSANSNTNSNSQGQGQSQAIKNSGNSSSKSNAQQAQSTENANNSKQSVTVAGDSTVYQAANIPVATAYAASIQPTAVCALSTSGGAQGVGFGFSLGGSYIDENCMLLEQVRATNNLGEREVAQEMMMGVPAYAAAKKRIADRKAGAAKSTATGVSAAVEAAPASKQAYTGNDPVVMSRLGILPLSK